MSSDAASFDTGAGAGVDDAEKVRRLEAVAPMVRAICGARLRGRDSDDAAQAALEQVWRAQQRQEFADEESVRRYAATVARVMPPSVDRRSVRAAPVGSVAEALWVDEAAGPAERFDRTAAMAEAADKVNALLGGLTPREREIIQATHLGERSTAEVAAELGLTPSGVRSAQTRAMARMRDALDTASPNPLASGVPERERSRAAAQRAGPTLPDGPRSAPVIEAARRFTTAHGRRPSRSELVSLTGTSSGTAQRVVRALREERAELEQRQDRDDVDAAHGAPLPVHATSYEPAHGAPASSRDAGSPDAQPDPVREAHVAVGRARARGEAAEDAGQSGPGEQLAFWHEDGRPVLGHHQPRGERADDDALDDGA